MSCSSNSQLVSQLCKYGIIEHSASVSNRTLAEVSRCINDEVWVVFMTHRECLDFGEEYSLPNVKVVSYNTLLTSVVPCGTTLVFQDIDSLINVPFILTGNIINPSSGLTVLANKLNGLTVDTFHSLLESNDVAVSISGNVILTQRGRELIGKLLRVNLRDDLHSLIELFLRAKFVLNNMLDYEVVNNSVNVFVKASSNLKVWSLEYASIKYFIEIINGIEHEGSETDYKLYTSQNVYRGTNRLIGVTAESSTFYKLGLEVTTIATKFTTPNYKILASHSARRDYLISSLQRIDSEYRLLVIADSWLCTQLLSSNILNLNKNLKVLDVEDLCKLHSVECAGYYIIDACDTTLNIKSNLKCVTINYTSLNTEVVSKSTLHIPSVQSDVVSIYQKILLKQRTHTLKYYELNHLNSELMNYLNEKTAGSKSVQLDYLHKAYAIYVKYKSIRDYEQSMYRLAHELYLKYRKLESQ